MKQEQESKQLITFNSLHVEVVGPRELGNNQPAIRGVTEFLHAVEHDVRNRRGPRAARPKPTGSTGRSRRPSGDPGRAATMVSSRGPSTS